MTCCPECSRPGPPFFVCVVAFIMCTAKRDLLMWRYVKYPLWRIWSQYFSALEPKKWSNEPRLKHSVYMNTTGEALKPGTEPKAPVSADGFPSMFEAFMGKYVKIQPKWRQIKHLIAGKIKHLGFFWRWWEHVYIWLYTIIYRDIFPMGKTLRTENL